MTTETFSDAPDYDRRLARLEQQLADLLERSSMPSLLPKEPQE